MLNTSQTAAVDHLLAATARRWAWLERRAFAQSASRPTGDLPLAFEVWVLALRFEYMVLRAKLAVNMWISR